MKTLCLVPLQLWLMLSASLVFASPQRAGDGGKTGWREVSRGDGVIVYRKEVPGSEVMAYRGVAVVPAGIAKVMAVLMDTPRRSEWTDRVKKAEIVREEGPCNRIEYLHGEAPWPVKDRDVVYRLTLSYELKDPKVILALKSIEDAARPPSQDKVRAVIHYGQFVLTPEANGKATRIVAEMHGDPKGSIPKWVIDIVQKRAPKRSLKNLIREVHEPGTAEDPRTLRFMELAAQAGAGYSSTGGNPGNSYAGGRNGRALGAEARSVSALECVR